jgi:translation initiation factor 2A
VFTYPNFGGPASSAAASSGGAAAAPVATASKAFFKAEEVGLKWSPTGLHLLIETRTATDKTGKSYYGESGLHLLAADGSFQGTVPFGSNPGPIQDVAWSPQGKEFLVIQGFQPAKSTLFVASNCTPIREYGTASRNTIRWSPHGRFLMLGGFGNLAGELEFWDSFKFKLLGRGIDRDGAKSYEWTPDGRAFITASLRPWRRVDNGYKVWSYAGDLLYQEKYDELYQVVPQPAAPGVYPNRPVSPRRKAMAAAAPAAAPAKPSAYIPPHLRAQGATAPSTIMQRQPEQVSAPRKLNLAERAAITGQPLPAPAAKAPAGGAEGEDGEEGSLSKNQLKRAKLKAREAKAREEAAAAAAAAEAEKAAELARKSDLSDPSVVARKLKAANKKLRAITDLKEKQAAGGGKLNEDQRAKVAAEQEVIDEIEQLTKLAASLPAPSAAE